MLSENTNKALGSEKCVWQKSPKESDGRISLELELPIFTSLLSVSIAICAVPNPAAKSTNSLPRCISLELGTSETDIVCVGNLELDGFPAPNSQKKNGSKAGMVFKYTIDLSQQQSLARVVKFTFMLHDKYSTSDDFSPSIMVTQVSITSKNMNPQRLADISKRNDKATLSLTATVTCDVTDKMLPVLFSHNNVLTFKSLMPYLVGKLAEDADLIRPILINISQANNDLAISCFELLLGSASPESYARLAAELCSVCSKEIRGKLILSFSTFVFSLLPNSSHDNLLNIHPFMSSLAQVLSYDDTKLSVTLGELAQLTAILKLATSSSSATDSVVRLFSVIFKKATNLAELISNVFNEVCDDIHFMKYS